MFFVVPQGQGTGAVSLGADLLEQHDGSIRPCCSPEQEGMDVFEKLSREIRTNFLTVRMDTLAQWLRKEESSRKRVTKSGC